MSARATVGGVAASAVILIVGWQLGSAVSTATRPTASSPSAGDTGNVPLQPVLPGSTPVPVPSADASPTTASPTTASGEFTGDAISTPFGDMQVKVTLASGTITDVVVLQATDHEGRSQEISARADPILRSEVLQAQSASVQMVSGATYTSDGYLRSLQSALDKAGA